MATIHDLPNPHYSSLNLPTKMQVILDIRAARRVTTPIPRRRAVKSSSSRPVKSVDRQLEKLTSEQALRLMELLSNGD